MLLQCSILQIKVRPQPPLCYILQNQGETSLTPYGAPATQLPGRLFSPSDISKKLSHHFLLHFPIGMGFYDHQAKYQGAFMNTYLLENALKSGGTVFCLYHLG